MTRYLFVGLLALCAPLLSAGLALGAPDAEGLLADYRSAKDPAKRIACVNLLGRERSDATVAALILVLEQDAHEGVRLAVVDALLSAKSHEACLALVKASTRWDPWVAERVVAGLARGVLPKTQTWLTEEGWDHDREDIRVASIRILAKTSFQDVLKKLRSSSKDKSLRVREVVAFALAGDPVKSFPILKRLSGDRAIRVRVAALRSLAKAPQGLRVLRKSASTDKTWQPRVEALRGLALRDANSSHALFLKLAKAKKYEWRTRRAAIWGLGRIRQARAVDDLIGLVRTFEGRLRAEARRALQALTRERELVHAEDWKNWWATRKEGFTFPKPPRTDAAPAPAPSAKVLKTRVRFYGLAVDSLRPMFVLDCSGSMNEPAKAPPQGVVEQEKGGTEQRKGPAKIWTKFEVAKYELQKALLELPAGARFGVLLFRERLVPLQERSVPATKREIKRVLSLLAEIKPQGGTDVYTALSAVLHGSEPHDPVAAGKVEFDTLYLLSDGLPTTGPVTNPATIRKRIGVFNRLAQVEIHTIGIGDAKNAAFMAKLAQESGGRFVKR